MLQTPSKYLSRAFLRDLLKNRCISAAGREYCAEEVQDLLNSKENEHALRDYHTEISAYYTENYDYRGEVTAFQERICASFPEIVKNQTLSTSSKNENAAAKLFTADTIFQLSENIPSCFIDTATLTTTENQQQASPAIAGRPQREKAAMSKDPWTGLEGRWITEDAEIDQWMDALDTERAEIDTEIKQLEKEAKRGPKPASKKSARTRK